MTRGMICAAALAATMAFAVPAQARMADPGLARAAPGAVQQVDYYRHGRWWRHHHRHRVCWTVRKTVRWYHGRRIVRKVRRCVWRW